jgi:hypothetical protein
MILKPSEITANARVRMVLYGPPGMAKSTTSLSAPNVLFVDSDRGWKRIPAQFKNCPRIEPKTYQEVVDDLGTPENLVGIETIVIDTGGQLLKFMKRWAIDKSDKNGKRDGALSIQGYGVIGQEFERLIDYIFNVLQKNVVVIFHSKEEKDGEQTVHRLDVEGQTKNSIFKPMDLAGFMETRGGKIYVSFTPDERYYAKGTGGVVGSIELPNVMKGAPNNFLTTLFAKVQENGKEEAAMARDYEALMEKVHGLVEQIDGPETALAALQAILAMKHVFASSVESQRALVDKTKVLGLTWVKDGPKQGEGHFEAKK